MQFYVMTRIHVRQFTLVHVAKCYGTISWIMSSYFPLTGFKATVYASTVDKRHNCAPTRWGSTDRNAYRSTCSAGTLLFICLPTAAKDGFHWHFVYDLSLLTADAERTWTTHLLITTASIKRVRLAIHYIATSSTHGTSLAEYYYYYAIRENVTLVAMMMTDDFFRSFSIQPSLFRTTPFLCWTVPPISMTQSSDV